jgi:ribosomal protein S18 acetylase RimI-like enzyme
MSFSTPIERAVNRSSLTMHPLDNVIWQALTTRQTHCAESCGEARRFLRDITLLGAFSEPSDKGYESLAELVGPGGTAALFLEKPYSPRPGWELVAGPPLLQMIFANGNAPALEANAQPTIVELGQKDSREMVELATLTKPGPFATRTHELGTYLGIRRDGKLVAMAGERMKVPGHTEVSAVCTHPECTGQGFARILMTEVMQRILARGETPFLHVREDNARAIALYQRLGFRKRLQLHLAVLRRNSC